MPAYTNIYNQRSTKNPKTEKRADERYFMNGRKKFKTDKIMPDVLSNV